MVMLAVLLVATLLVIGLLPPQEAQSKETKERETAQISSQEETTTPAENEAQSQDQQEEGEKTTPAEDYSEAQTEEELVLDEDPEGNEYVAGELLVTYKKGASKQAKDKAPKKVSGKVEKDFAEIEVQHISLPEAKNEKDQQARQKALKQKKEDLEQEPDVEAVDYNYVREGSMTPNDTRYSSQWAPPKINAPKGWDGTQGSSSVRVAILDSGFNSNHVDLLGKVVGRWDFVYNDSDPQDDVAYGGHGTLVAGIAAANTNNSEGIAGTCPNCSLLIAKVLNADNKAIDANVISGINWASSNGAKVINMSFGLGGHSAALETAVNSAWGKGAVVVAAAGNDGRDDKTEYPAAYPNVIAVAATDKDDKRAIYEWMKDGSYPYGSPAQNVRASNAGPWVDVAAPGKGILTTTSPYSVYEEAWGTSMAAPHVSGLAGLLFSKGAMTNTQVRKKIEETAKDLGTAGKDPVFGNGRIDTLAALSSTYEENNPAITYSGSWTSSYLSGASGNYIKKSTQEGASATFSFTGKSVTLWANKCTDCEAAIVYIDGSSAGWVNLYSSTNQPRQPVFTKNWSTSGNHTIKVVASEVLNGVKANVDAFSVM